MRMLCLNCFAEAGPGGRHCDTCGADLSQEAGEFEDKLLGALRHPVPDHQMTAVRVLGELKSGRAAREFEVLLRGGVDYYLAREMLLALSRIGSSESERILAEATHNGSRLVRTFAEELVNRHRECLM